jgi:hypothetical protein
VRLFLEDSGATQHDRLVGELTRLIREEEERGKMGLRGEPEIVAAAIVRLMESYTFNDAIAAVEPRLDEAMKVLDFVLA